MKNKISIFHKTICETEMFVLYKIKQGSIILNLLKLFKVSYI